MSPKPLTNRERQARAMLEDKHLKPAVEQALETYGYIWKHDRPARYEDGRHATHYEGHGGFPDIVAVHPKTGKILLFELKVELPSKGVVSDDQQAWLDAAAKSCEAGVASGVWRPMDWLDGTIEETIKWGTRGGG